MAKITPALIKEIFTEEVLDVLPSNGNIKRGVAAFERSQNPTWLNNVRQSQNNKETQKKRSNSLIEMFKDPQVKEKHRNATIEANTPEVREKKSIGMKRASQNPELKKLRSKNQKDQWSDPLKNVNKLLGAKKTAKAKWKSIYTPFGIFYSQKEAAEKLNVTVQTICSRIKKYPDQYYYVDEQGNKKDQIKKYEHTENCKKHKLKIQKPIKTPDGVFPSIKDASIFYEVKPPSIHFKLKRYPDQYYYITKEEYEKLKGQS